MNTNAGLINFKYVSEHDYIRITFSADRLGAPLRECIWHELHYPIITRHPATDTVMLIEGDMHKPDHKLTEKVKVRIELKENTITSVHMTNDNQLWKGFCSHYRPLKAELTTKQIHEIEQELSKCL